MSKITTYYEKQRMQDQLAKELEELEEDKELRQELDFKEKLESLMNDYGKSADQILDVMTVIEPKIQRHLKEDGGSGSSGSGPKRALKRYTNPHTGEIVETRGGNTKTLKAWREKHGKETVASWAETVS